MPDEIPPGSVVRAHELADYINSLKPLFQDAAPVRVTFSRPKSDRPEAWRAGTRWEFFGCRSRQRSVASKTETAVQRGERAAGDIYLTTRFDLLGVLPPRLARRTKHGHSKTVYRVDGDPGDWFVAGYYVASSLYAFEWETRQAALHGDVDYARRISEAHPFGDWFSLRRWDHELPWMGRLDAHDEFKRERMRMEVLEL